LKDEPKHSFNQVPLFVSHTLTSDTATIHRKLNGLLDADLIELVFKEKNRRTKYIHPTKNSFVYFEKMADAMVRVCRN
jgi:DNA-binding MarR family transcriptional regulator